MILNYEQLKARVKEVENQRDKLLDEMSLIRNLVLKTLGPKFEKGQSLRKMIAAMCAERGGTLHLRDLQLIKELFDRSFSRRAQTGLKDEETLGDLLKQAYQLIEKIDPT